MRSITADDLLLLVESRIAQPETMKVQVWVVRTGFPETTCHVTYSIGGGTATPGVDYSPTTGTLTFNPNEMSKPIWVTVNAANIKTPTKTLSVTLTGTPDATLGGQTLTQVTIKNTHPSRV
jgi:hypothetical protein